LESIVKNTNPYVVVMALKSKFNIFKGIGPVTEKTINNAGIFNWHDFIESRGVRGLSHILYVSTCKQIEEWLLALENTDAKFFASNLPSSMHWMLFKEFKEHVCYLDIETTGLAAGYDKVTVVGIYNGSSYQDFVRGRNLSQKTIKESLKGCKLLVTFFGSCFDVPFLRTEFSGINFNMPHFDLCFGGRKVGLTGGLKKLERKLDISRDSTISTVDGFEAVRLWHSYKRGNQKSLEKLLDYCKADTINLSKLGPIIYDMLLKSQEN